MRLELVNEETGEIMDLLSQLGKTDQETLKLLLPRTGKQVGVNLLTAGAGIGGTALLVLKGTITGLAILPAVAGFGAVLLSNYFINRKPNENKLKEVLNKLTTGEVK